MKKKLLLQEINNIDSQLLNLQEDGGDPEAEAAAAAAAAA